MSTFSKIEMMEVEENHFTIVIDTGMGKVLIADKLGRDEALGVLAACLFKGIERIPYARAIACRAEQHSEVKP